MDAPYRITVDTAALDRATKALEELGQHLGSQGGRLAGLPGQATSWTGVTATTLKGEMTRIGGQLGRSADPFDVARSAVSTFRAAVADAVDTVARLNARWTDAQTERQRALAAADTAYSQDVAGAGPLPQSDLAAVRTAADDRRSTAVDSANRHAFAAQERLDGQFSSCLETLRTAARTCGAALAGAVLAPVPADVAHAFAAGGGTGSWSPQGFDLAALTTGTRAALAPDGSVVALADGYARGRQTADTVRAWLEHHPTEPVPPEVVDQLAADADNAGYVQALMTSLGPGGMARLAAEARDQHAGRDPGAKRLFTAVQQTFVTGSGIVVNDAHGTHPLMDAGWLDGFDPHAADPLYGDTLSNGYRPDLLLPFLKDQKISDTLAAAVGDRALADYWRFQQEKSPDAWEMWRHYLGTDVTDWRQMQQSDPDDPFSTPGFPTALGFLTQTPAIANGALTAHTDAFMSLVTGQAPEWTGGGSPWGTDFTDRVSPTLQKILTEGTLGAAKDLPSDGDRAVYDIGAWLAGHSGEHLLPFAADALTDVLVDPRYLEGLANSVGTPFAPKDGVTTDPVLGALMPTDVWQALHQGVMSRPEDATRIVTSLGGWIQDNQKAALRNGYVLDENGSWADTTEVSSLDLFRGELVRRFLADNLLAEKDALGAELKAELADADKVDEFNKQFFTTLAGWVTNPATIVPAVTSMGKDFAVDRFFELIGPDRGAITAQYQPRIDALQAIVDDPVVTPGTWDDVQTTAQVLAADEYRGTGAPTVVTPDPSSGTPAEPLTSTGDPRGYVNRHTQYVGGSNPIVSDDFLTYGPKGEVTGVVPVSEMTAAQRASYFDWLRDPAVQKFLDGRLDGISTARDRGTPGGTR